MIAKPSPLRAVLFLLPFVAGAAHAAIQRTFVASSGDDASPCTLAQPCRSFGAAIAHTNANGEVIALDSAGYGPVTITKSVSIIAPPGVYAGITVTSGNGVTINAPNIRVLLRGLAINGQGGASGIFFQQGAELVVDHCSITNMGDNGVDLRAPGSRTHIADTIVRNNANSGVYADAFAGAVHVDMHRIALATQGWGVFVRQGAVATLRQSSVENQPIGVNVVTDNPGAPNLSTEIAIENTAFAGNGVAVNASNSVNQGAALAKLVRNNLTNNGTGVRAEATIGRAFITANGNLVARGTTGFDLISGTLLHLSDNSIIELTTGVDLHGAGGPLHQARTFSDNRFTNNVFDVAGGALTPIGAQ